MFKKKVDIMLEGLVKFVTENPVIILFGFISSIISFLEIVFASIKSAKNKKKEKEFKNEDKIIRDFLYKQASSSDFLKNLEKSKEEYEDLRKQIEIELPKKRKQAILAEQIRCEEQIIDNANLRLTRLKQDFEGKEKVDTSKAQEILKKVRKFVVADNTKELAILLLLAEAVLYLLNSLLGNYITKILSIVVAFFILFYVKNSYTFMKTAKGEKIICNIINISVSLCYFDALFNSNLKGYIWWLILSMIPSFISKPSNYLIDRIIPFFCIPLFFGVFVFGDYETEIIISIGVIQALLLTTNIIRIVRNVNGSKSEQENM